VLFRKNCADYNRDHLRIAFTTTKVNHENKTKNFYGGVKRAFCKITIFYPPHYAV
jgi:hypothetical protein